MKVWLIKLKIIWFSQDDSASNGIDFGEADEVIDFGEADEGIDFGEDDGGIDFGIEAVDENTELNTDYGIEAVEFVVNDKGKNCRSFILCSL